MTDETHLADVASRIVTAVENVAPKTFELLVRAEFLSALSTAATCCLLAAACFAGARYCVAKERQVKGTYLEGDYAPGVLIGCIFGCVVLAIGLGTGLPGLIDPEAVAASHLAKGLLP
jgi:hypothetical protein